MIIDNISDPSELLLQEDDLLFHYTSINGLLGISKTKYLFASAARYLNDSEEVRHFATMLKAEANRCRSAASTEELVRMYTQLGVWIEQRMVGTWGLVPFIACFSKNKDQLSQWRGYCPPGKGVSIGFRITDLMASADQQKFKFGPCIYELEEQRTAAREALSSLESELANFPEERDPSKRHPSQSFHGLFEAAYASLIQLACFMKHQSFHEESEWRVVSTPTANFNDRGFQFREGNSMLIPYVHFNLPVGNDGQILIRETVLGPTPNPELANLALTMLSASHWSMKTLRKHGCSSIPYRTW